MNDSPSPVRNVRQHTEQSNCELCVHRPLCLGAAATERIAGPRIRIERNASLFQLGDPVDHCIYSVRSGSFKIVSAAPHGVLQVTGFALAPEFLALNALGLERQPCSAVALEDSEVCRISWDRQAFKGRRQLLRSGLHLLLSKEIRREQHTALMLRNTHAEQRLADLLLSLSQRHAANGYSATRFRLPMSRCDLASFLGVTAECISRLIVKFKRRQLFDLDRRDVTLLDPTALQQLVAGQTPPGGALAQAA